MSRKDIDTTYGFTQEREHQFRIDASANFVEIYKNLPVQVATRSLVVGGGESDYTTIQAAVDEIVDNQTPSDTARWLILVRQGEYAPPDCDGLSFTRFQGMGGASVITCSSADTGQWVLGGSTPATDIEISGFHYRLAQADDTSNLSTERGCITRGSTGGPARITVENCTFDIACSNSRTNDYYGIRAVSMAGTDSYATRLRDIVIVTDSSGIRYGNGQHRWSNVDIHLRGGGSHTMDQIAVECRQSGRMYCHGGFWGTGYSYDNPSRDGANVYGYYVASGQTSVQKSFLRSIVIFARNESSSAGDCNPIYASEGTVRGWDLHLGGEAPNSASSDTNDARMGWTPAYAGGGEGGAVYLHGCVLHEHNVFTHGGTQPMLIISSTNWDDGVVLSKDALGCHFGVDLDAVGANLTLNIPEPVNAYVNSTLKITLFKGTGSRTLTLDAGTGNTILDAGGTSAQTEVLTNTTTAQTVTLHYLSATKIEIT